MDWEVCWVGKGEAHSPGGSNPVLSLRGIALPRRLPSGAAGAAQAPGRVQEPVGSQQHVACEHGLPDIQQSAGSPHQPLETTSGGVESGPGVK